MPAGRIAATFMSVMPAQGSHFRVPAMDVTSPRFRQILALAVGAAGVLAAWLAGDPAPLAVTVAAVCLRFGDRAGLAGVAVTGGLAWAILALPAEADGDNLARMAAFIATAFGVWLLIWLFRVASFYQRVQESTRAIIEKLPGLGWSADANGRLLYRNPASLEYEGTTFEEMKAALAADDYAWSQTIHPDDAEQSIAKFKHSIATGEPLYDESRARGRDGTYRWFRDVAFPTRDETGKITGWYGTSMDIDDQKKAEEALRHSERELQLLVDTVPVHIWLLTPAGEPAYYNRRLHDWLGIEADGLDGKARRLAPMQSHVHPDDVEEMDERLRHSLAQGEPFEGRHRLRRHDGAYRWIQSFAEPIRGEDGEILRWYGVNIDVDEEVRAQDELRVVTNAAGLGWAAYPDGRLRYINPAVLSFMGVTADELRKMMETDPNPLLQSVHADYRERAKANWERTIKTGEPLIEEQQALRHDGVYRWLRDTIVPTVDDHGKLTGWYGHTQDITEQKNAEEALRQSERELRLLVDTVPAMIYLTNAEGRPYYFNKRFADWVDVDPKGETVPIIDGNDPYAVYLHPDDREQTQRTFYASFAAGEPIQYRARLRRGDGEFRWVDARVEPLRDETGTIVRWYGVNVDVDDEVRAQDSLRLADERLSRASRAASLSELSVSIAHELNSPLQAVVANANAFQRWLTAKPPNYERAGLTADRIIRDANAAAEVIGRIRSLFAQTEQGRAPTDLNGIIKEVCDLVADRMQSNGVRLELALEPSLPLVMADRVQVEQVIINLVRNAIEAMHDTPPPGRLLRIASRHGDGVVDVEVNDRGHGIPNPDRIFDAFYTTKKDGMGMGLAICRSIIESHEGRIGARSGPGEGSSVGFTMPIYSEPDARVGQ